MPPSVLLRWVGLGLSATLLAAPARAQAPAGSTGGPLVCVGATYYVTASLLNMRKQPAATGIAVYQVSRHTPLVVRELPANPNWMLAEFTMGDEGVVAYVARWYLTATTPGSTTSRQP